MGLLTLSPRFPERVPVTLQTVPRLNFWTRRAEGSGPEEDSSVRKTERLQGEHYRPPEVKTSTSGPPLSPEITGF